jgi:hypothetical protein
LRRPFLPPRLFDGVLLLLQAGQTTTVSGVGSILRSGGVGAGAIFKTSAIPLAIFSLNRCCAVAPHVHPNAAETLFVIQGALMYLLPRTA